MYHCKEVIIETATDFKNNIFFYVINNRIINLIKINIPLFIT